jgi:hypothetical protein
VFFGLAAGASHLRRSVGDTATPRFRSVTLKAIKGAPWCQTWGMKNTHCYEYDGELFYDPFLDPIEDDEFYYWDPVQSRIRIGRRGDGGAA